MTARQAPCRGPAANPGMSGPAPGSRRSLFALSAGYFMVVLDVTVVTVAAPTIGRDLHAGVTGLQWVVDGYSLVLAALLLAGGP